MYVRDIECNIAEPRGASRGDDRLDRQVYLSGPALETDLEVTKNWLSQFGPVAMEPLKSERGKGEGIPFAFVTYPVVAQAAAAMAATPPPQLKVGPAEQERYQGRSLYLKWEGPPIFDQ